jgi:hypothetical protein
VRLRIFECPSLHSQLVSIRLVILQTLPTDVKRRFREWEREDVKHGLRG